MGAYKFLNGVVEIPENRLNYNQMRLTFEEVSLEATKVFRELYLENKNLDEAIENVSTQGAVVFETFIKERIMRLITEMGIYNVDEEYFLKNYYFTLDRNYVFDEVVYELAEKYFEIVMDQERLDAYRRARKGSRSRLVGGGFGVAGATKGMLLAGAGNMVSGGLHSVANGVGGMVSSIKAGGEKHKIFSNPATLDGLCSAFYESIFNLHLAMVSFINDYYNEIKMDAILKKDSQECAAILSNIENDRVNKSKMPDLLAVAIHLNPYNEKIYQQAIVHFGDRDQNVLELAKIFGIDMSKFKVALLNRYKERRNATTKESALEIKEEFLEFQELLGYSDVEYIKLLEEKIIDFALKEIEEKINFNSRTDLSEKLGEIEEVEGVVTTYKKDLIKRINKQIETLEVKSRTFDNVLYSTEADAVTAKLDKDRLIYMKEVTDFNSECALSTLLNELNQTQWVNITGKDELENNIIERLNELDLESRSFDGELYATLGDARQAKEEKQELVNLIEKIDFESEPQLIGAYSLLESKLQDNVYTAKGSLNYIEETLVKIKRQLRKKRTVKGVYYNSFNDADNARLIARELQLKLDDNVGDIEALLKLKKRGLDSEDQRMTEVFIKKVNSIIEVQLEEDRLTLRQYESAGNIIAREFKSAILGAIFFTVLFFIFTPTWVRVISILGIIGSIGTFFTEVRSELVKKNKNQESIDAARRRIKLIEKNI